MPSRRIWFQIPDPLLRSRDIKLHQVGVIETAHLRLSRKRRSGITCDIDSQRTGSDCIDVVSRVGSKLTGPKDISARVELSKKAVSPAYGSGQRTVRVPGDIDS